MGLLSIASPACDRGCYMSHRKVPKNASVLQAVFTCEEPLPRQTVMQRRRSVCSFTSPSVDLGCLGYVGAPWGVLHGDGTGRVPCHIVATESLANVGSRSIALPRRVLILSHGHLTHSNLNLYLPSISGKMDKTQDTTQQEFVGSTDVPKQSFPDKLRRSCVRFWWLYFLIFAALVLVIVLPMYDSADLWMKWKTKAADTTDSVYVGYPTLAQKTINRSAITLNSYAIRHPTPSSFDLGIDYTILSNSSNHANLDSYNASLYLPASETSLVTFEVPAVKSGKATDVSIDQNFTINHPEEFVKFCMVALGSDTYDLNVRGKGGLKLGILPRTSVKYNKTVQSKGLSDLLTNVPEAELQADI